MTDAESLSGYFTAALIRELIDKLQGTQRHSSASARNIDEFNGFSPFRLMSKMLREAEWEKFSFFILVVVDERHVFGLAILPDTSRGRLAGKGIFVFIFFFLRWRRKLFLNSNSRAIIMKLYTWWKLIKHAILHMSLTLRTKLNLITGFVLSNVRLAATYLYA